MEHELNALYFVERITVYTILAQMFLTAFVKVSSCQAKQSTSDGRSGNTLLPIVQCNVVTSHPRKFFWNFKAAATTSAAHLENKVQLEDQFRAFQAREAC